MGLNHWSHGRYRTVLYFVSVCAHEGEGWGWGRGDESIWACMQVSICALFVCHSPLKLQLHSRHDFPLCWNQETGQYLTRVSHQLPLRLEKTLGYCYFWSNISHLDLTYTCMIKTQTSQKEAVTKLPHKTLLLRLMKPQTFGCPTRSFWTLFLLSLSTVPPLPVLSDREKALNTASN